MIRAQRTNAESLDTGEPADPDELDENASVAVELAGRAAGLAAAGAQECGVPVTVQRRKDGLCKRARHAASYTDTFAANERELAEGWRIASRYQANNTIISESTATARPTRPR